MREGKNQNAGTLNLIGTAIAPASATTVYSDAFDLRQGWNRSLWVKAAGSGTITLRVAIVVAYEKDDGTVSAYVEPDSGAELIAALANTNLRCVAISVPVSGKAKIKFTGSGGNGADVTIADCRVCFGRPE